MEAQTGTKAAPDQSTSPPANRQWPAQAMLLLGGCIIGFAPILVRLTQTGPAAAGFWRLFLALPILALVARPWSSSSPAPGRGVWPVPWLVFLAGVFFALDLGFWHYGIALTTVANATVLANLTPVIVTVAAWVAFRERQGPLFLGSVAIAVAGICLMTLSSGINLSADVGPARVNPLGVNPFLGDVFSVVTAVWYAAYLLSVRRARQTMGTMRVMFWSTLIGTPLVLVFALILNEPILPATTMGLAACAGLAVVHVAGQGAIAWALGRLPTATASMVVLVQPVVAAGLGWLLLRETLGLWQSVGGIIALAGVVLSQLATLRIQSVDQSTSVPPATDL